MTSTPASASDIDRENIREILSGMERGVTDAGSRIKNRINPDYQLMEGLPVYQHSGYIIGWLCVVEALARPKVTQGERFDKATADCRERIAGQRVKYRL